MFYLFMLIMRAAEYFILLMPLMVLLHVVMIIKDRKNNIKMPVLHIAAVYFFCFVLLTILSITDIPSIYSLTVSARINVIPVADIFINFHQYVLNILLFVPLGFLLPMIWEKFRKFRLTFLLGFFFSLSIEVMQIFGGRIADIDDLLMNTLGTIAGYFLFMLANRIFPKLTVFAVDSKSHWKTEPYFCFCISWLVVLFLQPFVRGLLLGLV